MMYTPKWNSEYTIIKAKSGFIVRPLGHSHTVTTEEYAFSTLPEALRCLETLFNPPVLVKDSV